MYILKALNGKTTLALTFFCEIIFNITTCHLKLVNVREF
jgi:hypothetical protein